MSDRSISSSNPTNSAPEPPEYRRLPEPLGGQLATLDPHNERIKLYGESPETVASPEAQEVLEKHFEQNDQFTKLTVYAEPGAPEKWKKLGFTLEARIGGYFRSGEDAELWSRFSEEERAKDDANGKALDIAQTKEQVTSPELPEGYTARIAGADDAGRISARMMSTFPSYPDDVTEETLRKLIARQSSIYVLIEHDGDIASMACAQIDLGHQNAEISDCVTDPDHRGKGLMVVAIHEAVDYVARRKNIRDFYSMARADVVGINAALARAGFQADGRLVNNSMMPGGFESFNIWWRRVEA